jgi:outer membrane receptor protein involved in Fe transport
MISRAVRRILSRAHLRALALPLAIVVGTPGNAFAQAAALEEIVVTAQKREEHIQDVPISISAISGESLDMQGSRDFRDILRTVPGLSFAGNEPGMSRYSIRGVSTAASSPTTGLYLDDVSLLSISTNFAGAIDPPIFDLERIEVLKGPQGTLYGGSAMGGAIKFVSRKPDLEATTVDAAAGVSTTDGGGISYDLESVLNLPLVDGKVGMRAGILYREEAGYVDYMPDQPGVFLNRSATTPPDPYEPLPFDTNGTVNRKNANERTNLAGRLAFKFALADDLTILPSITIQRSRKDNPNDFWTNLSDFKASYRFQQPTNDDVEIYSLSITKSFDSFDLTALSGYFNRSLNWERDYSYFVGSLVPPLLSTNSYNQSDTSTSTFSQEIRLASSNPDAALKWVAGLFYSDQSDELNQLVTTAGAGDVFGTGTDVVYVGKQSTSMQQYAAFADATYSLTEQFEASLGLRWFEIDQEINGDFDGVFNGGPSSISQKTSVDVGLNPKLTLTYRPTDGHIAYVTGSQGFRPGGPNRFNTSSPLCGPDFENLGIDRAPATYESDNLWTYELGSKNLFSAGRVIVNGAVYYTDWKKIQQQVNLPSCGFQFVANIGAAEIKGAEIELRVAATPSLTLGGNASYTDSKITESAPGVSAKVGQPVLDTPDWIANAFLEYQHPFFGGWGSNARVDYEYHGSNIRQFDTVVPVALPEGGTTLVPDVTQVQDSYDVLNLSFAVSKDDWQAKLYVINAANSSSLLDYTRLLNTPNATALRPRTIGISIRKHF